MTDITYTITNIINALGYGLYAFLTGSLLLGFHRKIMARIQGRPGPPIIQYVIHTLKFYIKEITFPITSANPLYLFMAILSLMVWLSALYISVIFKGSLLIIIGLCVLQKIIEHGCGLSSGSPYGKVGGVRSVFSAAAEVPLFAVIGIVYILTHSLQIGDIINYQIINGPLILKLPIAALAFLVLVISKAPYNPFNIVKDKAIVSGYLTEHFGTLRALIMISDAIAWFVLLWLFIAIFIGPFVLFNPILFIITMVGMTFLISLLCSLTPTLTPNHSVAIQILITGITVIDLLYRIFH